MSKPPSTVLAIIGSGGMGLASARGLAGGKHVLIGDFSQANLDSAAQSLRDDGHQVDTPIVDTADFDSVQRFAQAAAAAGRLSTVGHTAGLSPAMAPAHRILDVDLVGTANVIDAFEPLMPAGSSLTCTASIARFSAAPSAALARHLATAPRGELLNSEELQTAAATPAGAYAVAKAGNLLRVRAAARAWGARGARINSVSPGVILTAMVRREMESPSGATITAMAEGSPGRGGAANEIACVVAFLAGQDASFVTGADLVVDGGFIAGIAGIAGMGGMAAWAGGT